MALTDIIKLQQQIISKTYPKHLEAAIELSKK